MLKLFSETRVEKNLDFLKKAQPPGFLGGFYWVLGFIGFLDFSV